MKLGYTIIYVPNVAESLSFFESAFGLSRRLLSRRTLKLYQLEPLN
jgi:catechol 2,3-dioxygenase-like lactoylglutathione lyase family enzyme